MVEGKTTTTDHPIAYVSGLFRGSQLNWAALTKEAYAIYMSVKKLAFYLTDADVLLKSDHLPLKKFLQKYTLNNKVNNWAMELEAFNIRFEHVSLIFVCEAALSDLGTSIDQYYWLVYNCQSNQYCLYH